MVGVLGWAALGAVGVETSGRRGGERRRFFLTKHPICYNDNIWIKLKINEEPKIRIYVEKDIFGEGMMIDISFIRSFGKKIDEKLSS